jgi:hypothetical protein
MRSCEQRGAVFAPRREHARICCARCRDAWNLDQPGAPRAGVSALEWSVAAMNDAARRLRNCGLETGHGRSR